MDDGGPEVGGAVFRIALGLSAKEEIVLEQNKKPPQ
jgi:hypothetical protein